MSTLSLPKPIATVVIAAAVLAAPSLSVGSELIDLDCALKADLALDDTGHLYSRHHLSYCTQWIDATELVEGRSMVLKDSL